MVTFNNKIVSTDNKMVTFDNKIDSTDNNCDHRVAWFLQSNQSSENFNPLEKWKVLKLNIIFETCRRRFHLFQKVAKIEDDQFAPEGRTESNQHQRGKQQTFQLELKNLTR